MTIYAMGDSLTAGDIAVLGITSLPSETSGTPGHGIVTAVNDRLATLLPGRFLPVHEYLRTRAMPFLGLTPTTLDVGLLSAGTVPLSLMASDGTHVSKDAARAIAVDLLAPYITAKGWDLA